MLKAVHTSDTSSVSAQKPKTGAFQIQIPVTAPHKRGPKEGVRGAKEPPIEDFKDSLNKAQKKATNQKDDTGPETQKPTIQSSHAELSRKKRSADSSANDVEADDQPVKAEHDPDATVDEETLTPEDATQADVNDVELSDHQPPADSPSPQEVVANIAPLSATTPANQPPQPVDRTVLVNENAVDPGKEHAQGADCSRATAVVQASNQKQEQPSAQAASQEAAIKQPAEEGPTDADLESSAPAPKLQNADISHRLSHGSGNKHRELDSALSESNKDTPQTIIDPTPNQISEKTSSTPPPEISSAFQPDAPEPVVANPPNLVPLSVGTQHPAPNTHAETAAPAQESPAPHPSDTFDQIVLGLRGKLDAHNGKAEIRLDPPNLGTLKVSVILDHGLLTAEFHSPSDLVRDLLKSNLEKLKTVLEGQGVSVDRLAVDAPDAAQPPPSGQQASFGSAAHDGRSAGQYSRDPRGSKQPSGDDAFAGLFRQAQDAPIDLVA